MTNDLWQFWIDVGGTFTDCIARRPDGQLIPFKLLSSGVTQGKIESISGTQVRDPDRRQDPQAFWVGYECRVLDSAGQLLHCATVAAFDHRTGTITLDPPPPEAILPGTSYQLDSGDEAPLVAIRYLLGLRLDQSIQPVAVRLGTTRGTNALLTRGGARSAFVTTKGFADVLLIAYQDRPRLFDLAIRKPKPLFEQVVEIDERLDAQGHVLVAPDEACVQRQLTDLKAAGIESLAICLLHSFAYPQHEHLVQRIAGEVGFREISTSSLVAPLIKIVARGDTTVVDAYLNPVLRRYVEDLRRSLPGSDLKVMTSAGGLVNADHFVGKDSILSGPAGGVVGFSRVAQCAGFNQAIGFDMGGTSTDVARFEDRLSTQLEDETLKAGVRILTPMLAIETVAAGGGSICGFDGVKLTVGPDSAGADPGPACYGRGGPLSLTDVNLFLGKILPAHFPFPLDERIVARKLQDLSDRIAAAPDGKRIAPAELAEGLVKVANANMVRAIRNISVAKGYSPKEHVLVTFGGAGGQHACAIARSLGIEKVLVHPFAGILSAYGIGLADVRRFAQQAVLKPYAPCEDTELEVLFQRLEADAQEDVRGQGVAESQIAAPLRSLDMRYRGAEATINVSRPPDGDYAGRFEQLHRQLFGFVRTGDAIEVSAARVEVVGCTAEIVEEPQACVAHRPQPAETTQARFAGSLCETSVFLRQQLRPGAQLAGPAILCEPTSTIVIDPGFVAEITGRGEILIQDSGETRREQVSTEAGPVMLEIFNNLFASIAEQMGRTLERTSFSTNIKERRDFSCAIFSATGDLVANAPHVPVHLGAMSETVKCILADNPDLKPGDVFVTNDPYRGGSHLPDVTVVTPVHDEQSAEILFFTACRAHHAEIGGVAPGSLPPFSNTLEEEGVLISNFRLVDGGTTREAELRHLLTTTRYPTRSVDENLADIAAQVAANKMGATLLDGLVTRYSLPVTQAYMQHIQDAASRKMRLALSALPDATYRWIDHLDDGATIAVKITIQQDTATVDFSGTAPVLSGNLNANRSIVTAAVLYAFRCMLRDDIPLNSGVLQPIEIVLPSCLLNPPRHDDPRQCAAVVGGNVETSSRVVDVLLGALHLAAASQGTMNNVTFGDDTFGYYETIGGGSGATARADGADAVHTHMTNTRLTDPEVVEHRYPVRIREFRIRRGSGGKGRHRGGDGIIRRIEFLRPLQVSLLTERRGPYPPFGLEGGQAGALGVNTLQRSGAAQQQQLGAKVRIDVQTGDLLSIETPGGGGYGKPL